MKTKLLIILITLFSLSLNVQGQKFRTLEQFQTYFLENYSKLDAIEGIWYAYLTLSTNVSPSQQNEFMVAIIKEANEYKQYTLEDGNYKPSKGSKKFTKDNSGYYCTETEDEFNLKMTSSTFYISDKKFKYELDVTKWLNLRAANRIHYTKGTKKYSVSKIFPLESDIIVKKNIVNNNKSTGTGFAISSDGYIVTNYHVIESAKTIKIKGVNGSFTNSYSAKVVLSDKNNDLAILKIDDYTFKNLGIIPYVLKSTSSNVGENIFVLGYPLTASMGEEIKLTNGIISSKSGFKGDITTYQITAPIQPGNSGAPLFDKEGFIIGIINAKLAEAENAGYAIKTNYLLNLIDALPDKVNLPTINTLKGKQLTNQVGYIKKYVFIIEIN